MYAIIFLLTKQRISESDFKIFLPIDTSKSDIVTRESLSVSKISQFLNGIIIYLKSQQPTVKLHINSMANQIRIFHIHI
jgi:hypothetical protein